MPVPSLFPILMKSVASGNIVAQGVQFIETFGVEVVEVVDVEVIELTPSVEVIETTVDIEIVETIEVEIPNL